VQPWRALAFRSSDVAVVAAIAAPAEVAFPLQIMYTLCKTITFCVIMDVLCKTMIDDAKHIPLRNDTICDVKFIPKL
jgi:hypothetical protein